MPYIKFVAIPDTWYNAGTEVFIDDFWEEYPKRPTLEEYEKYMIGWLVEGKKEICGFRGTRTSENFEAEGIPVGISYCDGEVCGLDEFEISIVEEQYE
jgi:hypothetical protein